MKTSRNTVFVKDTVEVFNTNGQSFTGTVVEVQGKELVMETNGEFQSFDWDEVETVSTVWNNN